MSSDGVVNGEWVKAWMEAWMEAAAVRKAAWVSEAKNVLKYWFNIQKKAFFRR